MPFTTEVFTTGMYETSQFMNMKNLKYLDISDNPVHDLKPLAQLPNLKTLHITRHPYIDENGKELIKNALISMSPLSCVGELGGASNPLTFECQFLQTKTQEIELKTIGTTEFSVPENVRTITLTACSAGDGGNGDAGKKGSDSSYWISDREIIERFEGGFYYGGYRRIRSVVVSASEGNPGQNGAQGEIVTFRDKQTGKLIFSSSNESFYENPIPDLDVCRGGYGGGNAKKGANKKIFEATLSVEPNQIFVINIPQGGQGGEGGLGGRYSRVTKITDGEGVCEKEYVANDDRCNGRNGWNGQNGGDGSNGYLKISYLIPV